jgi:hypothetical protein
MARDSLVVVRPFSDHRSRRTPPTTNGGPVHKLTAGEINTQLAQLDQVRATCNTCHGNPDLCRQGTPEGDRLPGCIAFNAQGEVNVLKVPARQPWDVRSAA